MMVLQENAVKANECLNNAFGCDEFGNILFPDDFSGARIEDELLVISLIDISPESVAKYIDWAGDYSEYIIFEEVDYSYNYLQSCAIEIVNELSRDGMNIVGCSISEKDNSIIIKYKEINQNIPFTYNNEHVDYEVPVSFEISDQIQSLITELAGGIGIYNETLGNAYFSMAACGNYRSNLSILSCGHGIQAVGDIIRYQSATGDVIGTVTYHRYENDMYGDFEFISVDASKFSLSNDIASGHSITGTVSNPAVNTIVKVYGSASDYVSYGVIEERGCVITPDEGTSRETTIRGMTKIKFQDANITNGDSGGTVFVEGTNGIQFCGVISSKYELYGFPYVYFTPYTYISAAGFTVKIN